MISAVTGELSKDHYPFSSIDHTPFSSITLAWRIMHLRMVKVRLRLTSHSMKVSSPMRSITALLGGSNPNPESSFKP